VDEHLRSILRSAKEFSDWTGPNKNQKWVQLYPYDTWSHPLWSDTTIDPAAAQKLVKNFDDRVMGRDLIVEYDHGMDKSKGGKAAGKVLKYAAAQKGENLDEYTTAPSDGVWGLVEFNDIAKVEIDNGEWNWMSNSHYDTWTHPQTKQTYEFVPENPSLTNRPYVRDMMPLNFSEIVIEGLEKEHSVWSTAYVNNLPDSSFLWIEQGGKKDQDGKTVPRSLRHLPYKDANGKVDLPHLRNAIARIPQMTGGNKTSLQAKARAILAKSHSDALIEEDDLTDIVDRIDRIPVNDENDNKGGEEVTEAELRALLGIGDDVDINTHVSTLVKEHKEFSEEIGPLRELKKEHSQAKQFSDMFPDQAKELEEARVYRQERQAKEFSEKYASMRITKTTGEGDNKKEEPTTLGFSALVVNEIQSMAKEFSEHKATPEQFTKVLDTILANGIVDFGTHGSSNDVIEKEELNLDSATPQQVRKAFSDRVTKILDDDFNGDMSKYEAAYAVAATKYPEMFEAYKTGKPVVSAAK